MDAGAWISVSTGIKRCYLLSAAQSKFSGRVDERPGFRLWKFAQTKFCFETGFEACWDVLEIYVALGGPPCRHCPGGTPHRARYFPPRATHSRRAGPRSPSREFSFAPHQIQQAIEPHFSLKQTLYSWNQIAQALAKHRGGDYFSWRNGTPHEHRSKTDRNVLSVGTRLRCENVHRDTGKPVRHISGSNFIPLIEDILPRGDARAMISR